jgi:hypothetical protein
VSCRAIQCSTHSRGLFYLYIVQEKIPTHHTLRDTVVVGGRLAGRLVGSLGVPQDAQLLHPPDAALAQAPQLDPVRSRSLIGVDYEIVSFT